VREGLYPDYVMWYNLRHDDPDYDADEYGDRPPEHLRYFVPEKLVRRHRGLHPPRFAR
jgi:hypothetical protein